MKYWTTIGNEPNHVQLIIGPTLVISACWSLMHYGVESRRNHDLCRICFQSFLSVTNDSRHRNWGLVLYVHSGYWRGSGRDKKSRAMCFFITLNKHMSKLIFVTDFDSSDSLRSWIKWIRIGLKQRCVTKARSVVWRKFISTMTWTVIASNEIVTVVGAVTVVDRTFVDIC